MFTALKKLKFSHVSYPLALLAVTLLAFAPLISSLGFYQDDWHFVYYAYAKGVGSLWQLTNIDGRPLAGWVYVAGFSILGFKPIGWHITALAVRALTALGVWSIFRHLWPDHARQTFIAGVLFALYPFFSLQPLAVAYMPHWAAYFALSASLLAMILARERPKRYLPLTALALLGEVIQMFTVEYFVGLELFRPIILWMLARGGNKRQKAGQVLKQWLPYLVLLLTFVLWRGFLYDGPNPARETARNAMALFHSPFSVALQTFIQALPDFVMILVSAWYSLLTPTLFDLTVPASRVLLPVTIAVSTLAGLYFYRLEPDERPQAPAWQWARQAFWVGVVTFLLGLASTYAAGYFVHLKIPPWNTRFSLGSQLGASLLIAALIEVLIASPKVRPLFLAVLIGLLVGWHLGNANDYRWAWARELDFYRQLTLRAPAIAPNTSLVAETELLASMGDYPTTFAVNTIYALPDSHPQDTAPYWFLPIATDLGGRTDGLLAGIDLNYVRYGITFDGSARNSLVISFAPESGQCLWLLRPEESVWRGLSSNLQAAGQISNPALIQGKSVPGSFLKLIGGNLPSDWCSFYEQADRADQAKDWGQVIQFWEKAQKLNLGPANGFEYLPFIEAYAQTRAWEQAFALTRDSNKSSQGMEDLLCPLWQRLGEQTPMSTAQSATVDKAQNYLGCQVK